MVFRLELPKDVSEIISVLENAGFEAYAVGGCVRDALLQRIPNDWDITTSAMPADVKRLFRRTVDTGIEHGTVTVMIGSTGYEVTTYRLDGEYEDCRHPKEVTFTKSLAEDLRRRDFTINAMAYNAKSGVIDLFGGLEDLHAGRIRCVGNPEERFTEDALRVFRAVRFAAQLGFSIDPETRAGMTKLSGNLARVSAERIREELSKLLQSEHPEELITASEAGLTAFWLPEWDEMLATEQENKHHIYDVGRHTIAALRALHNTECYRNGDGHSRTLLNYAVLLHDSAKPSCKRYDEKGKAHFYGHPLAGQELAGTILRRLKFDNDTIAVAERLVGNHDNRFQIDRDNLEKSVRRIANRIGTENVEYLFAVQEADIYAQAPKYIPDNLQLLEKMREAFRVILEKNQCVSLNTLAVKGSDLIALGYKPGPQFGEILNRLLEDVLNCPEHNTKEYLLSLL